MNSVRLIGQDSIHLGLLTVLRHLLHLTLELLGLAAQHFLLPALLETLLRIVLLIGEVFLPFGQRIELGERVFDILLMLFGRRSGLRGLVLVLFGVEFEIEEAGEVAARIAASTTCTARWPKATSI